MKFYFVTSNKNKLREAQRILGRSLEAVELDIPEVQAVNSTDIVHDKARKAYSKVRKPVLVEDSGLYVNAWNGFPGALIKWFLLHVGTDELCRMLKDKADRSAYAQTVICFYDGKSYRNFVGRSEGTIAPKPRGKNNFGWDSTFIPKGHKKTFAEMSGTEKDAISHRGHAFRKLKAYLDRNKL
jgi:non-canonical purine NTP pyrophosphatase (RdgB/HAM1 family)